MSDLLFEVASRIIISQPSESAISYTLILVFYYRSQEDVSVQRRNK